MSQESSISKVDYIQDVLIVGGGITGAGIFRDLALHGIKCLLIDKKDFSSQTSQYSSKMFHGGIRYLEGLNLGLVTEALREKNLWLKLAPHLCKESPFLLPIFKESKYSLFMTKIALVVYDILSFFKNSPHKIIKKDELIRRIPSINKDTLKGAGLYYDAIVDDSKITLESIYDGSIEDNALALNYTELINIDHSDDYVTATIQDVITKEKKIIKAKDVIFATGPFTDQLLSKFDFFNWEDHMIPSKGSHIWLKKEALSIKDPLVLQTKDNRIIFVIPYSNKTLVGTTEVILSKKDSYFDMKATKEEVDYLISTLNFYFPKNEVTGESVISSYAGVRPLVKENPQMPASSSKVSRDHKIIKLFNNISIIIGGKLTTFRTMGVKISKKIVKLHSLKYDHKITKKEFRQKSVIPAFKQISNISDQDLIKILETEEVRTFDDLAIRRLGIYTRAHSKLNDFDTFFKSKFHIINKYIDITHEDIENFK